MNTPLVTIGCAVYNGEATLARALSCVVGQDYPNLEILIADDGSRDGSRAIYEEFAKNDPRFRIRRNEKNVGIVANFNEMIRTARGKYIMFADQEDIRDKTFVSKAVAALEADPDAVLCHSHTGVFMGDPNDVKYITTLDAVAGVRSRVLRYARFLRHYTDTTVSGLIRRDVLLSTKMWQPYLGTATSFLFQLLLRGKFIQIPEPLYFYSAAGERNRPSAKDDYKRATGKEMPRLYFPFLVVAAHQVKDIQESPASLPEKLALWAVVGGNTSVVAGTKLVYRSLARVLGERLPEGFVDLCDHIIEDKTDWHFLNDADKDEHLFPKHWALKGGE